MSQITLKQFEGPFELLLSLVDQHELEITELALSEVTEQYVQYLDHIEDERAEYIADFLVVASRLLLLKAKSLLPQFLPDEEDGPSLEVQLRLYKMYVEASTYLQTYWERPKRAAFRKEPTRVVKTFVPPKNVSQDTLHKFMVHLIQLLAPPKALPNVTIDKTVSLKEKIQHIRMLLSSSKRLNFNDVLSASRNKSEIIVGFLALLELVKQQTVHLKQEQIFGNILVERSKES